MCAPRRKSWMFIRFFPASCNDRMSTLPSLQAIRRYVFPSVSMLPGKIWHLTFDIWHLTFDIWHLYIFSIVSSRVVHAAGYGDRPRTKLYTSRAVSSSQRIWQVSLKIFGAGRNGPSTVSWLCGMVFSRGRKQYRKVLQSKICSCVRWLTLHIEITSHTP